MARHARPGKWLYYYGALIVMVAVVAILGRSFLADSSRNQAPPKIVSEEQWIDAARQIEDLAAEAELRVFSAGEATGLDDYIDELISARWQQQDLLMEEYLAPPAGVPIGSTTSAAKKAPQATAAEAQLTLQTYLMKLNWQEKAMVLKTLTKFSPGEMLEVFQLYKKGSRQAYRDLDAIVMAKMSETDFEKLRALVGKYR